MKNARTAHEAKEIQGWALLSGHTLGNRLDRRAKPGEGAVRLCRVHSVLRTPLDVWSDETLRRHRRDEALLYAYRDEQPGIRIAHRMDGHLLNQRRMHFQSRVSTTTVHELLFAVDCVLNTTSEEEIQRSMDLFSAACENFGLVINTQKTVVMHQPTLNSAKPLNEPQTSVN
nr:unnamed protein product [Spirometra erinaceieuropaei]